MDFRKHQAFTLLELMITITIIGILSAIAIPTYQNYSIRTTIAGEILPVIKKTADEATVYFLFHGSVKDFCASGEATKLTNTGGDHINSYLCEEGASGSSAFHLQASLKGSELASDIPNGGRILMFATLNGGVVSWHCGYHDSHKIPSKYLPPECRENYIGGSGSAVVGGVDMTAQSLGG